MKPPPFRYIRAPSLPHALETLAASPGAAKVLAGGQSLMPMLNFRLLEPSILVDINGIDALRGIEADQGFVRVGALTRHRETGASPIIARHFPMLTEAVRHIAHMTIRNRGTFAGSLCHADPAAELPLMSVLLDARLRIAGPLGERVMATHDFFLGALTTALGEEEIMTAIELPLLPQPSGWSFHEVARRQGDYALAAVAVTVSGSVEKTSEPRIALAGVGQTPLRASAAEQGLVQQSLDDTAIDRAARIAAESCAPMTDLHASADYRRHLVEVLVRRGLRQARERLGASQKGGRT